VSTNVDSEGLYVHQRCNEELENELVLFSEFYPLHQSDGFWYNVLLQSASVASELTRLSDLVSADGGRRPILTRLASAASSPAGLTCSRLCSATRVEDSGDGRRRDERMNE